MKGITDPLYLPEYSFADTYCTWDYLCWPTGLLCPVDSRDHYWQFRLGDTTRSQFVRESGPACVQSCMLKLFPWRLIFPTSSLYVERLMQLHTPPGHRSLKATTDSLFCHNVKIILLWLQELNVMPWRSTGVHRNGPMLIYWYVATCSLLLGQPSSSLTEGEVYLARIELGG